jgi:2-dehydropantoate 2-reductase
MRVEMTDKWQIIGAGAIGCLWAANLIQTGQRVHLVSRNKHVLQSLTYQDILGKKELLDCSHSNILINSIDPILVCVKAPQVKQALLDQQKHIRSNQIIILMHNGMGAAEQVAEIFPNNPIICATTANACLLNSPLNIKQTGLGITFLGPFNEQAKKYAYLANNLNRALNDCHWCEDINQKLWLKLLINIAINPLTAIHQVNNGELAEVEFQKQINEIIVEAIPVLHVLSLEFHKKELIKTVNKVINATAENYSSMNRDIYFNRTTENKYISGYLLKKASQHNIETPLIKSLYQQIKVLENRSLAPIDIE